MKVTLPVDYASTINEMGGVAALLDKTGWRAGAMIATAVAPGEGQGTSRTSARGSERVSAKRFARDLDAKGWSENIVRRHFNAWEQAADAGLVPHADEMVYGIKVELPTDGWADFYPPVLTTQHADADAIIAQAEADGTGPSKAVDIAKNPKAMAAAIIASPKVREAAAQAIVDAGDIDTLSRSTAKAAQNRVVERNRQRREDGRAPKGKPAPLIGDAGADAFLAQNGLGLALTALVSTFPAQWAAATDDVRADNELRAAHLETLDRIDVASSTLRAMLSGSGDIDSEFASLLNGGAS